jgi:3-phenylpropionate/trans-cinnamate dioxygenase ferredoxin subunit
MPSVALASHIAPGTTLRVDRADEPVLLCNVDGTIYAIEDTCTHDGGALDGGPLQGCEIECPRHGARFDVTTGAALSLPAFLPVKTYTVRREGDEIFIDG